MWKFFVVVFNFSLCTSLFGQLSQTEMLLSFEMEYIAPIEMETSTRGKGKLGNFIYHMGVDLVNEDVLVLLSFLPDDGNISPHISVPTKIATLATNEEEYKITMLSPSTEDRDLLGADWVAHASFRPKNGIGRYRKARLSSLFREGVGLVYILYLHNEKLKVGDMFRFMDL